MTELTKSPADAAEAHEAGEAQPAEKWIALLESATLPADGVEDYCTFLGAALRERNTDLQLVRVPWNEIGWSAALKELAAKSAGWRGRSVLLQYTSLGWSARGFPFRALQLIRILQRNGARVVIVYHECSGQVGGARFVQSIRTACQDFVIRRLHRLAAKSIFTIPLETIPWLPVADPHAAFIPIGANIPQRGGNEGHTLAPDSLEKTVAIFCSSPGPERFREAEDIVSATRDARRRVEKLHLLLVGKGTDEIGPRIERELEGSGVRISIKGMLPAPQISECLSEATVQLFVRDPVSQMRGCVLAGIACGLPVIGYGGAAAGTPIENAGLQLVPFGDRKALGAALSNVLADAGLREELHQRSLRAQRETFSWATIAEKFLAAVGQAQYVRSSARY